MEKDNHLYKNQGIHVISSIFTIDKGVLKVLLIKRKKEFHYSWNLIGGTLYNNERLLDGMKREIKEKTGLGNIDLLQCKIFDDVKRSSSMRMIAVSYIGLVDIEKVKLYQKNIKNECEWFLINQIPNLAYDHNAILESSIQNLKERIIDTDILKSLYPKGFTLPELQKIYEAIYGKKIDRRNFRKKLINSDLIYDTKRTRKFEGNKPAKVYNYKIDFKSKSIF